MLAVVYISISAGGHQLSTLPAILKNLNSELAKVQQAYLERFAEQRAALEAGVLSTDAPQEDLVSEPPALEPEMVPEESFVGEDYGVELEQQVPEAEMAFEELVVPTADTGTEEDEEFLISDNFFFIPNDSEITLQRATIKGDCRVGEKCRILGNYFISGKVKIGDNTKFHGSIGAGKDVDIGSDSNISGNISCKGDMKIGANTHIRGSVKAKNVEMLKSTIVDGTIQAKEGVSFTSPVSKEVKTKIERFERGLDDFEAVLD